jgi:NAD(P)H-dependent FMN reductase
MPKILAFAGSARRESWNKKLITLATARARELGAEVTLLDMADYPLPLFDGDLETRDGVPENASRLRQLMVEHDGLLLCCPEYNSSITPLLKNTIDWTSRPAEGVPSLIAYRGKVVCLLSASPGGFGGLRGLVTVRSIFGNIGALVIPDSFSLAAAHTAFADDGSLLDAGVAARLDKALAALVTTATKLTAPDS